MYGLFRFRQVSRYTRCFEQPYLLVLEQLDFGLGGQNFKTRSGFPLRPYPISFDQTKGTPANGDPPPPSPPLATLLLPPPTTTSATDSNRQREPRAIDRGMRCIFRSPATARTHWLPATTTKILKMNDPENATHIIEDMVHDQLVLLQEARMNLTVARMAAWMAKREFSRLGAILFSEETEIPIVTLRDVQFVHEWGPRFGWTGVPFYPVPNNINVVGNLPEDVIRQHCFVLGLILWGQGGKQEEMIHRAHNRLQQFENAWESYDNAAQDILQPKTVYDHAALALVKATIIPVVNQNQLELCRVLRDKFAWFGNAKFPGSPNILQFYGVLTPAEAREDEEEVTRLAANMHFDAYVRR